MIFLLTSNFHRRKFAVSTFHAEKKKKGKRKKKRKKEKKSNS